MKVSLRAGVAMPRRGRPYRKNLDRKLRCRSATAHGIRITVRPRRRRGHRYRPGAARDEAGPFHWRSAWLCTRPCIVTWAVRRRVQRPREGSTAHSVGARYGICGAHRSFSCCGPGHRRVGCGGYIRFSTLRSCVPLKPAEETNCMQPIWWRATAVSPDNSRPGPR